jgi:hypothetical protein
MTYPHDDGMSERMDFDDLEREYAHAVPPEDTQFSEVPDGAYQVKVERVELGRTKLTGRRRLKWGLTVLAGEHKGQWIWRQNMIETAENCRWLKKDLAVCGVELDTLAELDYKLKALLDIKLDITVRKSGDFHNVYFNARLDAVSESGDGTPF